MSHMDVVGRVFEAEELVPEVMGTVSLQLMGPKPC